MSMEERMAARLETLTEGRVQVVLPARRSLGEGAVWCPLRQKLLWIDITRGKIFTFDEADGSNESVDLRQAVGTVVPLDATRVVAATGKGVGIVDLTKEAEGVYGRFFGNPCDDWRMRFNDGKCDPQGRLWVGTMGNFCGERMGALYSFELAAGSGDADSGEMVVRKHLDGVSISNGIVWSADGRTMYYIDTATTAIDAFDFDPEKGGLSNRRQVIRIPPDTGYPDGCTIDSEDKLWICFWEGWSVQRWDPVTGTRMAAYRLPCAQVTSCAFGGANLDQLYITTASCGLSEDELERQPEAGHLFKIDLSADGVKGQPPSVFGKGIVRGVPHAEE